MFLKIKIPAGYWTSQTQYCESLCYQLQMGWDDIPDIFWEYKSKSGNIRFLCF